MKKQNKEWKYLEHELDYILLRYAEVVGTKEAPEMREFIKSYIFRLLNKNEKTKQTI